MAIRSRVRRATRTLRPATMAVAGTASALTAVTVLAGCGDQPAPDGTARIAIDEPRRLVPTDADDPAGAQVLAALFTPLVDIDDQGRPYEVAAESVTSDPDSQVWTIKLREEFTFHDGEPVTADNYLAAWNYGAYGPSQQRNSYLFQRVDGYAELNPADGTEPDTRTLSGLKKVDEHTFTVTLADPFVDFRSMLGATAFYPLPAAAFESDGVLDDSYGYAPVGNGPFQLVGAWEPGSSIELERYEDFPGSEPEIGEVEFVTYQDPVAAYGDLRDGNVDVVTRIPDSQLAAAAEELGDRLLRGAGPILQYLAFPAHQEELADPEIRRAISMALDRDQLAAEAFGGVQAPARAFVPPVVPGARPDTCGTACELNPAAAQRLYQQAGGPEQLTITYNLDGGHQDWVEAACAQLASHLGVECVAVAEPEITDLLARVDDGEDVGLVRQGWTMDYPSMESYLGPVYSTQGSANFAGYHNPTFDALLAAGAAALTEEEAVAAYQRAEDLLAADLPVIPVRFAQPAAGHTADVPELTVSPYGHIDLTALSLTR